MREVPLLCDTECFSIVTTGAAVSQIIGWMIDSFRDIGLVSDVVIVTREGELR